MNTRIWKWRNTAHITKMSIEGTVALVSLAVAITTILIATNVIATHEPLALISVVTNPIGIAAIYFAALAYCSYKQIYITKGEKGEKDEPWTKRRKSGKGEPSAIPSSGIVRANPTDVVESPEVTRLSEEAMSNEPTA